MKCTFLLKVLISPFWEEKSRKIHLISGNSFHASQGIKLMAVDFYSLVSTPRYVARPTSRSPGPLRCEKPVLPDTRYAHVGNQPSLTGVGLHLLAWIKEAEGNGPLRTVLS